MTGDDIAKKSGGFTTICSILMAIIFYYTGETIGIVIGIGLSVIAAGLMWNNYNYFMSNREYNRLSSWEILMRRCGLAFAAFMLVAFSTFMGSLVLKGTTQKTNNNTFNNLKTESDTATAQISHSNQAITQDSITNNSVKKEIVEDTITKESVTATPSQTDTQSTFTTNNNISTQSLSTIRAEKSFFYKDTNVNLKRKHLIAQSRTGSYCVKGDKVFVLETTPNWSKVSYTSSSGKTEGWILSSDLE